MSSKRKPYYHLKLSPVAFYSLPVRYLKEYYGKESAMEKPYQEGRAEMHQDIPEYDWKLPKWNRPQLPPFPKFPDLPPFKWTPFRLPKFPEIGHERPPVGEAHPGGINPWTGNAPQKKYRPSLPGLEMPPWEIQDSCNIEGGADCLDEGETTTINAASNGGEPAYWGVEISRPDLLGYSMYVNKTTAGGVVQKQALKDGKSLILHIDLKALAAPNPSQDVEVCVFMGFLRKGKPNYRSLNTSNLMMERRSNVPSYFNTLEVVQCGCVTIEVPCDPCSAKEYQLPVMTALASTIAPGTAPCATSASTVGLLVQYGAPPYTWSVSGTGFCLDYAVTTGVNNTLRADNTACGPATVTVTDYCGNSVTVEVRSTAGFWCTLADYTGPAADVPCLLSGEGEHITTIIKIEGKYRMVEYIGSGGGCCPYCDTIDCGYFAACMAYTPLCLYDSDWYTNLYLLCSPGCFALTVGGGPTCSTVIRYSTYRAGYEWKCAC